MAAMTKVDLDNTAFREGLFVRALGRPCSSNPYPPNSEESVLWESGWRLIDAKRLDFGSTTPPAPLAMQALLYTPPAAEGSFRHEDRGPRIVRVSRRRARLIDATIALVFAAVLLGMWMLMMSR
jgi:hypothetical protein